MSFANVARFLPEIARARPDACAVRAPLDDEPGGTDRIAYAARTFAELDAESDAAARLLRGRGIKAGTRVLLLVRPGLDLLRCVFALFKLGAPPVLIDPGMGRKNFLECVRQTQPEALVAVTRAHWLALLFPGAMRTAKIRVRVGGASWERALAAHRDSAPLDAAPTRADDLAAILFTSGSTGAPKGVRYEHGMFEAQVRLVRERYGIAPGEVDLAVLPVFALFNPALGMTTIVPEIDPARPASCDPARLVLAIRQNAVTNSFGSPAIWARVARHCEERGVTLPSLRRVLIAGAPVHPKLLRRLRPLLPNSEVHIPYGATEALPVSSISSREVLDETWVETERGRGACVGAPLPEMAARILPLCDGSIAALADAPELPPGEIGEIAVSGPVVTRAYDGLPEATAAAKIPAGDATDPTAVWHRMGDLGWRDGRGRLWFCGRVAERVVTPERVYYPECVEAVFNRHPRVARSALVGLRGAPAVVIEPEPGAMPRDTAEFQTFVSELRALGAEYPHTAAIAHFHFQRALPVDVRHNAKIHRLALARDLARR